jgi:beta-lactamase regulating signal transducer with metallopeptidase domain
MAAISPEWINLVWQQVWQCTLLALIVWLICRVVRIRRAHLAYLLWLVVLLKFVTPPIWSSSSGLFCWLQNENAKDVQQSVAKQPIEALTRTEWIRQLIGDDVEQLPEAEFGSLEVTVHDAEESSGETTAVPANSESVVKSAEVPAAVRHSTRVSWLRVGLWSWAGVAACIATVMLIRFLRCWRTIRSAGAVQCPELEEMLVHLAQELGVKRQVRLMVTQSRIGPAVVGLWRPTILLPAAIAEARSPAELEPILAHELIHIRRGDLWIGLLQLLAAIVWWFHPLVWLTGRRLKFEMEQCCDEEVLAELNCDPRLYAAGLLEILELKQTLRTVPVVPGVRPLEITSKRMERIMRLGQGSQKRTPWWCWVVFVAVAAVVLPGAAFVAGAAGEGGEQANTKAVSTEVVRAVKPRAETQRPSKSVGASDKPDARHVPLLAQEIDIPKLVINSSKSRTLVIDDLLARAKNVAGVMRANGFLIDQIRSRIAELPELEAESPRSYYDTSAPFYFETLQIPMRDERKQYRIRKMSGVIIKDDQLEVFSANPAYHRHVERVLAELRENEFTKLIITTTLVSISERFLQDYLLKRKSMKVFTRKQSVQQMYRDLRNVIWNEPEQVSYDYLVCDVLDQERSRDFMMKFLSTPNAQVVFVPPVSLEREQSATIASKIQQLKGQNVNSLWWNTGERGYGVSIDLETQMSDRSGAVRRDMLDYQLTFYQVDGETRIKTGQDGTERPAPLISQQVYKDAMLLKPGETLLAGGFPIAASAREEKRVLLVMLQAERESVEQEPESEQLKQGQGVNSNTGVTGRIQLDAPPSQTSLRTISYPVADLVVPVSPLLLGDSAKKQAPVEGPRFEPLIELIQQNVTPDAWEKGPTIRAFEEKLSLVIRADQATHDQIADLIARIRAVQDRVIAVRLGFITTNYQPADLKKLKTFASPQARELWEKLMSDKLDEGILLTSAQTKFLSHTAHRVEDVDEKIEVEVTLSNGQSTEFNLSSPILPDENSKSLIQLRPELVDQHKVRLSFVMNAKNALDAITHSRTATVTLGQSLLIDITDQLQEGDSTYTFDQLVRQAGLTYQKQGKRCFLLVTPSLPQVGDKKE